MFPIEVCNSLVLALWHDCFYSTHKCLPHKLIVSSCLWRKGIETTSRASGNRGPSKKKNSKLIVTRLPSAVGHVLKSNLNPKQLKNKWWNLIAWCSTKPLGVFSPPPPPLWGGMARLLHLPPMWCWKFQTIRQWRFTCGWRDTQQLLCQGKQQNFQYCDKPILRLRVFSIMPKIPKYRLKIVAVSPKFARNLSFDLDKPVRSLREWSKK